VGCGEGVSLFPLGRGLGRELCPLPRNFFDIGTQKGGFWCILHGCYFYHFNCLFYKRKAMILALGLGKLRIRCVHVTFCRYQFINTVHTDDDGNLRGVKPRRSGAEGGKRGVKPPSRLGAW